MKSYHNPTCADTLQSSTVFCTTEGCELSAFGCSDQCMKKHPHGLTRKTQLWCDIEIYVQQAIENRTDNKDFEIICYQEKQLKILVEEVTNLIKQNCEQIYELKRKLKLKEPASKLVEAIHAQITDKITGNDMAQFVKLIQTDRIFNNQKEIHEEIDEKHKKVDSLLTRLRKQVQQIKCSTNKSVQIPTLQISAIKGLMQIEGVFADKFVIKDGVITVKPENSTYFYPILRINQIQSFFQVEVVENGIKNYMIGVAQQAVKNTPDGYNKQGSFCLSGKGGIYQNGKQITPFALNLLNGDRIKMKIQNTQAIWQRNNLVCCNVPVPLSLRNKPLFPVCWIQTHSDADKIAKIRFIDSK